MFEGCFFKTCDDRPLSAVLPICILVLLFISAELLVANCFVDSWYLSRLYAFLCIYYSRSFLWIISVSI